MNITAITNPLDGVQPSLGPLDGFLGQIVVVLGIVSILLAIAAVVLLWHDLRRARQMAAITGAPRPRALAWPRGWHLVAAILTALLGVLLVW